MGCVATGIVAVVVTTVKFADGAFLVLILIPVLVSIMLFIRREYDAQAEELYVRDDAVIPGPHREQRVVIPVNGINRAVVQAVNFGRTLASDVRAVYVTDEHRGRRCAPRTLGSPALRGAARDRGIAVPRPRPPGRRLP